MTRHVIFKIVCYHFKKPCWLLYLHLLLFISKRLQGNLFIYWSVQHYHWSWIKNILVSFVNLIWRNASFCIRGWNVHPKHFTTRMALRSPLAATATFYSRRRQLDSQETCSKPVLFFLLTTLPFYLVNAKFMSELYLCWSLSFYSFLQLKERTSLGKCWFIWREQL